MAWSAWYTSFSDAFKKRAGRYLINKYLGTFLDETVSLEQLSVDGAISLNNVALNIRCEIPLKRIRIKQVHK